MGVGEQGWWEKARVGGWAGGYVGVRGWRDMEEWRLEAAEEEGAAVVGMGEAFEALAGFGEGG